MKFFIKSYGCQMNSYDSQRMADLLIDRGYELTEDIELADLVIFNTCSIREKADEKLFSDLGRAHLLKKSTNNDLIIVVTGCVAQSRTQDIIKRAPYVNVILGPQDIHLVVEKIDEYLQTNNAVISTLLNAKDKFNKLSSQFYNRTVSEFLTIQEGCDNFCTYCVVPYTRGREFSRNVTAIINEAKQLIEAGVKEITLLGQNVSSYRGEGPDDTVWNLSRLLYEMAELQGLKRLRYTTSNPKDINDEIGKAHRDIDILMPFLHLPVQSGSDGILRKMNRKYTSREYLECINMLRDYRSDIAFSSDFIVGFPGETDEDFTRTLELVEKVGFAQAYSFKYSPRPLTPAATMNNQVDEALKSERLRVLQNLLNSQQNQFNHLSVGKEMNVLFEKYGKYEKQLVGRSEYSQAVSVCSDSLRIGDMAKVKITEAVSHSLIGEIQ